ncbi:hypothetical protein EIW15_22595 [Salmonella enterica subsp. enterica serovar Kiambu]|nr:hypothetical protein [Salmonella enterica]ECA0692768.1 hypothetical protein [Salmonella enterica subsp. enterica serovar Kiambu]
MTISTIIVGQSHTLIRITEDFPIPTIILMIYISLALKKGMNGVWKKKFGMLLTFERLIILYYQ